MYSQKVAFAELERTKRSRPSALYANSEGSSSKFEWSPAFFMLPQPHLGVWSLAKLRLYEDHALIWSSVI